MWEERRLSSRIKGSESRYQRDEIMKYKKVTQREKEKKDTKVRVNIID